MRKKIKHRNGHFTPPFRRRKKATRRNYHATISAEVKVDDKHSNPIDDVPEPVKPVPVNMSGRNMRMHIQRPHRKSNNNKLNKKNRNNKHGGNNSEAEI